jgi:membrane associated rhomboid family serine protease
MISVRPKTPAAGPEEVPWVCYTLIGLNVLVHLLLFTDPRAIHELGFAPSGAGFYTVVTSMFVHGSWWHLVSNMLFLWIFGPPVERLLGHRKTLLLYAGADFTGSLVRFVFESDSIVRSIGASGAICGLMGAYGWIFRRERVDLNFRLLLFEMWSIDVSVLTSLVLWAVAQSLMWLLMAALDVKGGIGYGAHVVGFCVGVTVGVVISKRREAMLAEWRRRHAPDVPCTKCGAPARFAVDDLYRCRKCASWCRGPRPELGESVVTVSRRKVGGEGPIR